MKEIAERLKRDLRRLFVATLVLYALVVTLVVAGWLEADSRRDAIRRESDRTTRALCLIREQFENRIAATREFLREHPKGVPGIPASVLRSGVASQQITVTGLRAIHCGK